MVSTSPSPLLPVSRRVASQLCQVLFKRPNLEEHLSVRLAVFQSTSQLDSTWLMLHHQTKLMLWGCMNGIHIWSWRQGRTTQNQTPPIMILMLSCLPLVVNVMIPLKHCQSVSFKTGHRLGNSAYSQQGVLKDAPPDSAV